MIKEVYWYEPRLRCPINKNDLSSHNIMNNCGVCASCGHIEDATVGHYEKYCVRVEAKKFLFMTWGRKEEEVKHAKD